MKESVNDADAVDIYINVVPFTDAIPCAGCEAIVSASGVTGVPLVVTTGVTDPEAPNCTAIDAFSATGVGDAVYINGAYCTKTGYADVVGFNDPLLVPSLVTSTIGPIYCDCVTVPVTGSVGTAPLAAAVPKLVLIAVSFTAPAKPNSIPLYWMDAPIVCTGPTTSFKKYEPGLGGVPEMKDHVTTPTELTETW